MPFQLIRKLEQERGDLHAVIPPLVEQYGQIRAGRILGISASTVNKWLKDHGYRRRVKYERIAPKPAATSVIDEVDVRTEMPSVDEMSELLAEARDERDWRRDLLISGPASGWRGGDALENAYLLERLTELIRALEKRLQLEGEEA